MAIYRRGSRGSEVKRIQHRLADLGHYRGPLDGIFGGGTEAAVRSFQRAEDLHLDGVVGPETWRALFDEEEVPEPGITTEPLRHRSLALTGSFETGEPIPECFAGLSGDFDGQGISFGALQWNLGQGSLQPLLRRALESHPDVMETSFGERLGVIEQVLDVQSSEQLAWARSIQGPHRHRLREPWRGAFRALGRTEEFQEIELEAAGRLHDAALDLCHDYGLRSERAVALMFDIKVQNGSIPSWVESQIREEFRRLEAQEEEEDAEDEEARLRIVANRRAEASNPRWVEDVRRRKLTIATGRGTVHGMHYDLAGDYGIRLQRAEVL